MSNLGSSSTVYLTGCFDFSKSPISAIEVDIRSHIPIHHMEFLRVTAANYKQARLAILGILKFDSSLAGFNSCPAIISAFEEYEGEPIKNHVVKIQAKIGLFYTVSSPDDIRKKMNDGAILAHDVVYIDDVKHKPIMDYNTLEEIFHPTWQDKVI